MYVAYRTVAKIAQQLHNATLDPILDCHWGLLSTLEGRLHKHAKCLLPMDGRNFIFLGWCLLIDITVYSVSNR